MMKKLIGALLVLLFAKGLTGQINTLNLKPRGEDYIGSNLQSLNPEGNMGPQDEIKFSRSSTGSERSLLKFDLSGIPPGVDILSANLVLKGVSHLYDDPSEGFMQMVPDSWNKETVNWNIALTLEDETMPFVRFDAPKSATENYTLEVQEMVQKMVNSPLINFGWLFRMENESAGSSEAFSFGSGTNPDEELVPELIITYCEHMKVEAFVSPATSTTGANAGVFLKINGGVPPFTYLWSNSSTAKDIYNVSPGLYTVTVSDSRGFASARIIPVSGNCGSLTFSISSSSGGFSGAKLINTSFNENSINMADEAHSFIGAANIPQDGGISLSRSLLSFNLDALPDNVQVTQATLKLADNEVTQPAPFHVELCRAGAGWNERTATYASQPAYNPLLDVIDFTYDASEASYALDVSAHIEKMITERTSQQGWLLKLKSETPESAGNSAKFQNPQLILVLSMPTFACDDSKLNWNQEDAYDENGTVISSQKSYLDNLGRLTQKLVKNAAGEVFRTQTVYDSYGLAAVNSMPAYSGTSLTYQTNFMLNQAGQSFSYTDFDTPATLESNAPLQNGITNSLGNYYSDSNPYDAYQATAVNPYSRVETSGSGVKTRASKSGSAFKMGSGRESLSFELMSGDELKYIFGTTGSDYYSYKAVESSTNVLDCAPLTVNEAIKASKSIVISPDNPEMITYHVGDKVIASCYSGLSAGETYTNMTTVTNTMMLAGTRCVDIHLPYADRSTLKLPLPSSTLSYTAGNVFLTTIPYQITDLYTDVALVANTDYTLASNRSVTFSSAFLARYANRSMFLRISFNFNAAYLFSLNFYHIPQPDVLVTYRLSYGRASKSYYDLGNALLKTVSPKGFDIANPNVSTMATTFDYSHKGQLIGKKSPDEGRVEFVYNKLGYLRFTQNAVQKANNYFNYINYDKHGRAYESGENHTAGAVYSVWFTNYYSQSNYPGPGAPPNNALDLQDGLSSLEKTNVTSTSYTIPSSAEDIPPGYSYRSQYRQFRNGQANFIKNANSTTWYNYDRFDRKRATITQITEATFVAKRSSINDQIKTSESSFNYFTGLPITATYQANNSSESLAYSFGFDVNYRPITTAITYNSTSYTLSSASYNKMGQLKRNVIGNNFQGQDFVYTLSGGLKSINHPGLDATLDPGGDNGNYSGSSSAVNKDLFGESIDCYYKDYERSGTNVISSISSGASKYDGLIYATRFKTQNVVNAVTTGANSINYGGGSAVTLITTTNPQQQELRFEYRYDQFNQLAGSVFQTFNNSTNAVTTQYADYEESGASGSDISYDRNGNITRLVRKAYSLETLDNLTYTINSTNNQVSHVLDAAINSYPQSTNFKTASITVAGTFGYNAIGQMTASPSENISSITYFPNGKIKKIIFTNSNTTEFEYGAMGEKLKSTCYYASGNKYRHTWYVGPYLYEFDEAGANSFVIKEAKVPGGVIRVGSGASITTGYLVYNLTDHLGNVRVSFTKKSHSNTSGTGIEILSYTDYYAFGGRLPGRSYSSENYRYAYQGQEKAEDGTIWDQFELRNYNHDLGRWFTPDPYGEFASPYIAMGNNPVSVTDPDGGQIKLGDYGTLSIGGRKHNLDRLNKTGAFSAENMQKTYNDRYTALVDKYLNANVVGSVRDPGKFLEALQYLNNDFSGLAGGTIGMANGTDYLSQNEIVLNHTQVKEITRTSSGSSAPKDFYDDSNDRAADANSYQDVGRSAVRISDARGSTKVTIEGNGAQRMQIEYRTDGSEVHTYYDSEGEVTSVGYRSEEYVTLYNTVLAGTSFETSQYKAYASADINVFQSVGRQSYPGERAANFPGVTINVDPNKSQGYYNPITKTINVPGWATKSSTVRSDYIMHEYGHYLQQQKYGNFDFMVITAVSLLSGHDPDHMENWTEIEANILSQNYYLSNNPGATSAFFDTNTYKTVYPIKP